MNEAHLRFILGLKLKTLRQARNLPLREVAARARLSVSYLSEIEKGKKYPKPDKLLTLADALGVPFDELVSVQVSEPLNPLKTIINSTFVQEFPFELFGVEPQELFGLVSDEPTKAGALFRTFAEIVQMYDVQVEHVLFAALRSYQHLHANYFEDLEREAAAFRAARAWPADAPLREAMLRAYLEEAYGYEIDTTTLPAHPVLHTFRSVYADRTPPRLYLNGNLLPSQRAFVLAREIGFRHLGLSERPVTSSWIKAESFTQVLNNYRASYFAGALFIDPAALEEDLAAIFDRPTWQAAPLQAALQRHNVTPEMFFYRLAELLPKRYGLREWYFLRFSNAVGSEEYRLTKVFNMSSVPIPYGIKPVEGYCRRWPAKKVLRALAVRQQAGGASEPMISVDRTHFTDVDAEFLVLSIARPLALTPHTNSCVSMGFLLDDRLRDTVRFWDDPAIPRTALPLTQERNRQAAKEQALAELLGTGAG
ncbi:XRE family transcriptional regulator [Rhodothermaceae bacterium RA]|nr:XRE family transcriptional regulator [Rhodothermaceae bacterium RA]